MNKILITGGAGNIGSSLAKKLISNTNNYVVIVDNLSTGSDSKLPASQNNNWKFIKADVNDYSQISTIMISNMFDYVFHYAAVVGVARTLENPHKVLNDIRGIENILELSKNTGVKRVFYSSSSEVYGEPVSFPQNEDTTPLNSRLPYAIVKNVGEAYFRTYNHEYGMPYTVFRFFNTYGPNQSEDFVVPKFLKKCLRGEDITIYGKGDQTRTFCYVDDNIDTTINALFENKAINDTLNIGNDHEITILELAELCITKTKSKSKLVYLPPLKEGDMTRRQPDISKMKEILKRPMVSLEAGIEKVIEFYNNGAL